MINLEELPRPFRLRQFQPFIWFTVERLSMHLVAKSQINNSISSFRPLEEHQRLIRHIKRQSVRLKRWSHYSIIMTMKVLKKYSQVWNMGIYLKNSSGLQISSSLYHIWSSKKWHNWNLWSKSWNKMLYFIKKNHNSKNSLGTFVNWVTNSNKKNSKMMVFQPGKRK